MSAWGKVKPHFPQSANLFFLKYKGFNTDDDCIADETYVVKKNKYL